MFRTFACPSSGVLLYRLFHCRMWCYAIGVDAVVLRSWCVVLCTVYQLEKIIVKLFASSWYIFLTYMYDARSHLYQTNNIYLIKKVVPILFNIKHIIHLLKHILYNVLILYYYVICSSCY